MWPPTEWTALEPSVRQFYCDALTALTGEDVSFLVGGAYAFERYTGIARDTKDIDIFVRRVDAEATLETLRRAGCETELTFPHWLGKAYRGSLYVDVIFSSGNGIAEVDDLWFKHAVPDVVLGHTVRLVAPEEMIWSKSFVMERERYDGADIAHLLRAKAAMLDWDRLLRRFGPNWRVLFSHLVLFGFIYPSEAWQVPSGVLDELSRRLTVETQRHAHEGRVCRGTLLSRAQYLSDIEKGDYQDPRMMPAGNLTEADAERWTQAIEEEKEEPKR